jgi:hypothetical protein
MGERDDARHSIESAREHMSEIADELSHRANPGELKERAKERAKEMVTDKSYELRERIKSSPKGLGLLGGLIGATSGLLLSRYFGRDREYRQYRGYRGDGREYGYGYPEESGTGLREKASEVAGELKGKGEQLKDKLVEKKDELKGRASEMKYRMKDKMDVRGGGGRLWSMFEERPLIFALAAAGAGALLASLIPLTEREQEVMGPLKQKAVDQAKSAASEVITTEVRDRLDQPSVPRVH